MKRSQTPTDRWCMQDVLEYALALALILFFVAVLISPGL